MPAFIDEVLRHVGMPCSFVDEVLPTAELTKGMSTTSFCVIDGTDDNNPYGHPPIGYPTICVPFFSAGTIQSA